jgi:hypothetical protein
MKKVRGNQRYTEITHDPLTFKRRGGRGESVLVYRVLCSLATVMSCIDASLRIVTKSPKVGPLIILIVSISLEEIIKKISMTHRNLQITGQKLDALSALGYINSLNSKIHD